MNPMRKIVSIAVLALSLPSLAAAAIIECAAQVQEVLPVVRVEFDPAYEPVELDNERLEIDPRAIISKEILNPEYYNSPLNTYAARWDEESAIFISYVPHTSHVFEISEECHPQSYKGCQYKTRKKGESSWDRAQFEKQSGKDRSLQAEYGRVQSVDFTLSLLAYPGDDQFTNLSFGLSTFFNGTPYQPNSTSARFDVLLKAGEIEFFSGRLNSDIPFNTGAQQPTPVARNEAMVELLNIARGEAPTLLDHSWFGSLARGRTEPLNASTPLGEARLIHPNIDSGHPPELNQNPGFFNLKLGGSAPRTNRLDVQCKYL